MVSHLRKYIECVVETSLDITRKLRQFFLKTYVCCLGTLLPETLRHPRIVTHPRTSRILARCRVWTRLLPSLVFCRREQLVPPAYVADCRWRSPRSLDTNPLARPCFEKPHLLVGCESATPLVFYFHTTSDNDFLVGLGVNMKAAWTGEWRRKNCNAARTYSETRTRKGQCCQVSAECCVAAECQWKRAHTFSEYPRTFPESILWSSCFETSLAFIRYTRAELADQWAPTALYIVMGALFKPDIERLERISFFRVLSICGTNAERGTSTPSTGKGKVILTTTSKPVFHLHLGKKKSNSLPLRLWMKKDSFLVLQVAHIYDIMRRL